MTLIDRLFVKKSFTRGAANYDHYAVLQDEMNQRLVNRYCGHDLTPGRILDIGMGTGSLTLKLLQHFPRARVYGCDLAAAMIVQARHKLETSNRHAACVVADAETLPFCPGAFDLAASAFAFQWLEDWTVALHEVRRVLAPGGLFIFSAFGSRTLYELRSAYTRACAETGYDRGDALVLTTRADGIKRALAASGFSDPDMETLEHIARYPTVNDLVKAIKGMGARNASARRNRTAGVRAVWDCMVACYQRDFGGPEGVRATFEIIMGMARRP